MRKIGIILITGFLLAGCSLLRKSNSGKPTALNNGFKDDILELAKKQNITNGSFFIQKAEIEINTQNGKVKFLGTIRFEYPDKFLISLKSRTGIEGARIYICKDSLIVNDRINKKMYFGKANYFRRKFGFDQSVAPLIFGDVILEKKCESTFRNCVGGKADVDCYIKGIFLKYIIDCNNAKVQMVSDLNSYNQPEIEIKFSKYLNLNDIMIPGIIEFYDSQYNITSKIKIVKVVYPWTGSVKFVPGKGYELIELI